MFNAKVAGEYECRVPIYLEDCGTLSSKAYMEMSISGSAMKPRILFDRREVILPPVPLNIPSRESFRVLNDGFQSMKISVSDSSGFTFEFPDGKDLGISK